MKKTQNGITLIALIITIVVLLILAVVTIGAVRDSNIVGYAQNAATMYELSQDNEVGLLGSYETEIKKALSKDRTYILPEGGFYIKVSKDNKTQFLNSTEVLGEYKFEYVNVTNEIIEKVNEDITSDKKLTENISDYSTALKVNTGDEEYFYLLLSKDEKILYYVGYVLILEGEDELIKQNHNTIYDNTIEY